MVTPTKPKPKTERPTLKTEKEVVRVLYYGDPGKAKTTNAAAMSKLGRVIYIDAERGAKPTALANQGAVLENIEPYKLISYAALLDLAWETKSRVEDGEPIVGVVWDSLTATLPYFLDDLVKAAVAKAQRTGTQRDSWVTQMDDYGAMTGQIREVFRLLRDLPIHLALTAHSRRDTDEEGKVRVLPAVTPALQNDLMAFTDLVIHVRANQYGDKVLFSGVTQPVGKFEAKDRFGVFPVNLATPTFDRLVAYVEGELEAETDPVQLEARQLIALHNQPTTTKEEN
jgi:hypothetical protein